MELAPGFLLGVATLPFLYFWGGFLVLNILVLFSLSGEKESWGWASVFLVAIGVGTFGRFQPTFETVLLFLVAWVVIGVVYSIWRWFWQCRKLGQRVKEKLQTVTSWPAVITVNTRRCELYRYDQERNEYYDSKERFINAFKPLFSNFRGRITLWTVLWPIFLLRDLTVDLIEFIQDLLKGVYEGISNKAFHVD